MGQQKDTGETIRDQRRERARCQESAFASSWTAGEASAFFRHAKTNRFFMAKLIRMTHVLATRRVAKQAAQRPGR